MQGAACKNPRPKKHESSFSLQPATCNLQLFRNIIAVTLFTLFVLIGHMFGDVTITVKERKGITRTNEPVTMGVPFARGEFQTNTPRRITNGSGTTVDAQFQTMALWSDGSVKWLKCDFQATVNANSSATYTLKTEV